jgi:hypothetical protein
MGMLIKEAIPILHNMYNYYNDVDVDAYVGFDNEDNNAIETALDTMHKYQQLQTEYENRLKADMVAMLTDIHLEMESLRFGQPPRKYVVDECLDVIQQKIDALKGEQA